MEDPKGIWMPWAEWSIDNFEKEWGGDGSLDMKMLNADTDNDIALIVLTAVKRNASE